MTETRAPYRLTHPQVEPHIADLRQALVKANKRLQQLEAAANEVCRTKKDNNKTEWLTPHDQAVRDLGNLIDYPGWWHL